MVLKPESPGALSYQTEPARLPISRKPLPDLLIDGPEHRRNIGDRRPAPVVLPDLHTTAGKFILQALFRHAPEIGQLVHTIHYFNPPLEKGSPKAPH